MNIPCPDDLGKRLLHGACGATLGFFFCMPLGHKMHFDHAPLIFGLAGALALGALAFIYTDYFWEGFGPGR